MLIFDCKVIKMNHRWQSYNTMQEQRIKQLVSEVESAQALAITPEREESINRALDEAKSKLQSLENQKKEVSIRLYVNMSFFPLLKFS